MIELYPGRCLIKFLLMFGVIAGAGTSRVAGVPPTEEERGKFYPILVAAALYADRVHSIAAAVMAHLEQRWPVFGLPLDLFGPGGPTVVGMRAFLFHWVNVKFLLCIA